MTPQHHALDHIKAFLDVTSIGVAIAAVLKALPEVTVVLSFIWVCMRMYNSWLEIRVNRKQLDE